MMKPIFRCILILLISSSLFGAVILWNWQKPALAAGSLYLLPSSKTVSQGATLGVAVRINSGGASVDSVQANLSYPADKLDFVSISSAGSAFGIEVESSGGSGSIRIARTQVGGVGGDKLIATVNFKAKVSSGSAAVSFASGSEGVYAGNPVVTATSAGSYLFTSPAPPPPPPPPPDTAAPKITDVKLAEVSYKAAVVIWKTDEPATSAVEYGLNTKYGLLSTNTDLKTNHSITLSSELLIPGETYHFMVKSADAAGNIAVSDNATFRTKGYQLKIKVIDSTGKQVKGAKVTVASEPKVAETNEEGVATFNDVSPGKHLVTVELLGKILSSNTVDVKEATEKEIKENKVMPQTLNVTVAASLVPGVSLPFQAFVTILLIIAALVVIGVGGFWLYRKGVLAKFRWPQS